MPFLAEELYQNLVRSADGSSPESVHLADFPVVSPDLIDEPLMDATRLAMRISSMGRGARSRAGVKVRQPLGRVVVRSRVPEEGEHITRIESQILDELNIKGLQLVTDSRNGGQLYQRAIEAAASSTRAPENPEASQVEAIVQVDQYWVSLEGGYMVAVDTAVTPELAEEGLARELVRRIQNLRRSAQFEITDRIVTHYQGPQRVRDVMEKFASYVQQETLSDELVYREPEVGCHTESQKLNGMDVVLGVARASSEDA